MWGIIYRLKKVKFYCKKGGFLIELFCGFVCILHKSDYQIKDCLLEGTCRNIFCTNFKEAIKWGLSKLSFRD